MGSLADRVVEHARRWIARGYRPNHRWTVPVEHVVAGPGGRVERAPLDGVLTRLPAGVRFAALCPTFVDRAGAEEQRATIVAFLDRVEEAAHAFPGAPFVVFVGMQWRSEDERHESLRRLAVLAGDASARDGLAFVGLSLPGPGKIRTLNAAIRVAEALNVAGLAWVDDDVRLEPRCLERMFARFDAKGGRGAVGATKIASARPYLTSRVLARAKAISAPATNYPHACCILAALSVLRGGIPDRYASDDGFVCFSLLDPTLPDPLVWLELVPDARCHYYVAGPAGETVRRIRRLLLNHHVYLADYPLPVARCYFRHILFYGMWPLAPFDRANGIIRGVQKAAIKWAYFALFAAVGMELYLRGLAHRPLRGVTWGGYTGYEVPGANVLTATGGA